MVTSVLEKYEVVIGLEVHVQLKTRSKMFCSCRADYQTASPNTLVCPVCLGLPGTLPVINRRAVEFTMATGLALNCEIAPTTKFDRKNYPYPDLMKGYQISQYDSPIATKGLLEIESDSGKKKVGITRVHLEEDVAKLQHVNNPHGESFSLVDVNRSGVPLMEIVGEPDIRSAEEARQYLTTLRSILQYIGVTTGNMEEGSFRCDANVSIRPKGSSAFGTRTEIKNMNSFRSVYNALLYEVDRQAKVLDDGGRVVQETRGWVDDKGVTVSQRSKEHAHDYRYFPEPDLPPLVISREWVSLVKASLPELPSQRRDRFVGQYGLPLYDAEHLTSSKDVADFFESAVAKGGQSRAKSISNWMLSDVTRVLNLKGQSLGESAFKPDHLSELVELIESGTLSNTLAKTVLEEGFESGKPPSQVVKEKGLAQISDTSVVEAAVQQAISENPKAVEDYIKGKDTASRFLVGQVMRLTRGKGNPTVVNELVKKGLEALKSS
ncbi:MAG: Asp-tRNA(Asn)/Glu-tRNA(Gln) amidotransferase subunit GatB [SAR202 cluster bacterium]|nr:Asp-tRNA(Asn)/Glu-tRNA(Gln) amidotransferase subunit GatB [SAR202 cluster bacterium]